MTTIEIIGENIRILRQKIGLSQEQLALHAGLNTSYIGQIERAEKNPTVKTLEKISSALEVSIIDLISPTELRKGEANQSHYNPMLNILTPEALKRYLIEILKDEHLNTSS